MEQLLLKGKKALVMQQTADYVAGELEKKQAEFDFAKAHPVKNDVVDKFKASTVKGSQFKKPFLEFSGASLRLWHRQHRQ